MSLLSKCLGVSGLVLALLLSCTIAAAQAPGAKPLQERDIVTLVELQIGEKAIVERLTKAGIDFAASEEALARLKQAGASDAVLEAVTKAAAKTPPADAITYEQVRQLLELDIGEAAILQRLEKSPTQFVLSTEQTAELKGLGASDGLIAALAGRRPQQNNVQIRDFVLILDCSGSMKELNSDGVPKMEVARRTVLDLLDRTPLGRRLAFVVYGHDEALKCEAVKVVRKMGRFDEQAKTELASYIRGLQPVGSTPIALALKTAGAELNADVPSTMLLISDGMETCKGDPAGEAAALAAKLNLTFGVVGFDVKDVERQSLEAIAKAGKGSYYNARSAAELLQATEEIAEITPGSRVNDSIEVWVEKNYQTSENPLHTEFIVNGKTVDIFSSSTRKPLSNYLQAGWNTIALTTRPQTPAKGSNGLIFRVGPVVRDPQSGKPTMTMVLWQFRNDADWVLENGRYRHPLGPDTKEVTLAYRVYYAGLQHESAALKAGDYVLEGTPDYGSTAQPLSATAFVNGEPLNSFVSAARQVVITPLLKLGRNELKLVSTRVKDAFTNNDITIDVAGQAEYRPGDQSWRVQPILSLEAMQGWTRENESGRLTSPAAQDGEMIERTVVFYVEELPGQKAAIEPVAAEEGDEASEPVTDPIEVWVKKNYSTSENPLHTEFKINGRIVDVFSSHTRKPIARHLRRGWNTITLTTTPQTPANGSNGLIFEIGPAAKDPKSGDRVMKTALWRFRNDTDWSFDEGNFQHPRAPDAEEVTLEYRIYYAGLTHEPAAIKDGDYVLQGEAGYTTSNVPLAASVFVNGTPLNGFLTGERQVVITPLLKQGKNEIKLVTHAVTDAFSNNDITFDVGGPAKYNARKMTFELAPVVQFKAMLGWERSAATGQLVNSADPEARSFERTVTFFLQEAP